MGSTRSRLTAGLIAIVVASAGAGVLALAQDNAPKAQDQAVPAAAKAAPAKTEATPTKETEKDKEKEKESPSTATTQSTTPPAGGHTVKKGKLSFKVQGDGVFVAAQPFELRLKMNSHSGSLKIVSAAPNGGTVRKGDTLLAIDTFQINNEVTAAENDFTTAKAALAKAESDVQLGELSDALSMRMAEQDLKNTEANVKWFEQVDGPHMLIQTEQQVKMSKANVEDQADELDQLRKMYKEEELTSATADIVIKRALRQYDISKTSNKMTEERASKVQTHSYPIAKQSVLDSLEQTKQRLASLKASQAHAAVVRRGGLTTARIAFANAEKKLADLKGDQALFNVKAPADGVVIYGAASGGSWQGIDPKTMKPGERLTAGQTVMTLFSPGSLEVELSVPESQVAWVKSGTKATVTPVAFPEMTYTGTAAEPTVKPGASGLSFYTTVKVSQLDGRILPGMKATVKIDGGELDNVLLVPVASVSGGKVWVKDKDGKEAQRDVVTGRTDGKMMEVREGLSEGDIVLPEGKK